MGMSRSENMRCIHSKNTKPELAVRHLVWGLGFRGYRLHRTDIPGKPDLAWLGRKMVIFVHGCFWHGHDCTEGVRKPKSNQAYWVPKIERNRQRDVRDVASLEADGWLVLVVWECELKDKALLLGKLVRFLKPEATTGPCDSQDQY